MKEKNSRNCWLSHSQESLIAANSLLVPMPTPPQKIFKKIKKEELDVWLAVTRNLLLEGIKRLGIYVFADNCKQATAKVNP